MKSLIKSVCKCLMWLIVLLPSALKAQEKFEFNFNHDGKYSSVNRFEQVGDGKYLIATLSGIEDSVLVVDVQKKEAIPLKGLQGTVLSYDIVPEQSLVFVHTGERYLSASQCFIYDTRNFVLKKVLTIGKAKPDPSKRFSWDQPQSNGYKKMLQFKEDKIMIWDGRYAVNYSVATNAADTLFKLDLPKDYEVDHPLATYDNGVFTTVIYLPKKGIKTQEKLLWFNSNTKEQKLIDLPGDNFVAAVKTFKSELKWHLILQNDKKSTMLAFSVADGKVVYQSTTKEVVKNFDIDQKSGDLLVYNGYFASLLQRQANGSYNYINYQPAIGEDAYIFAASDHAMITNGFSDLWIYNFDSKSKVFSLSLNGGSQSPQFAALTEWPGKKAIFYVLDDQKSYKFMLTKATFSAGDATKVSSETFKGLDQAKVQAKPLQPSKPHLVLQDGHQATPTSIVFSKSKKWMISGDESGTLLFWDQQSKMLIKKVRLQRDAITGDNSPMHIALHPTLNLIAVSWNYDAVVWIDFDGKEISRLKTNSQSNLVHFSEDGKYFFYMKDPGRMTVLDLDNNKELTSYEIASGPTINNFSFSGDSRKIAVVNSKGTVSIIDALNGSIKSEVKTANTNKIRLVAYHPGMEVIATLASPMELCLTNLTTGKSNMVLRGGLPNAAETVWSLIFTQQGEVILPGSVGVAQGVDGSNHNLFAGRYNPETNYLQKLELYRNTNDVGYLRGGVADADGKTVWTYSANNTIDVWDIQQKAHIKALTGNNEKFRDALAVKGFNGLLLGSAGAKYYLRKVDFGSAKFDAYDGIKFGTENFYAGIDDNYESSFASGVNQINLTTYTVVQKKDNDFNSTIVGNTPFGALVYLNKALFLYTKEGSDIQQLYKFDTDKSSYFEKDGEGIIYCFSEDKKHLFLSYDTKIFDFNLEIRKNTIYQLDKAHRGPNALAGYQGKLVYATENILKGYKLYEYDFDGSKLTDLTSSLKQKPVFSDGTYKPVIGTSNSGWIALTYVKDTVKVNGRSMQQLEVFKPNQPGWILKVREEPVTRLTFSADEKQLYVFYRNQIEIFSMADKQLKATFSTLPDGKFILFTPDNYYFASPKFSGVGFNINDRIFDVTQFDLKFNRPDIVLERLGMAPKDLIDVYKKAYEKRLGRLKLTEDKLDVSGEIPQISITNKSSIEYLTAKNETSLQFHIAKGSKDVKKLFITVNDVPVNGMNGIDLVGKTTQPDITQSLKLVPGSNKITSYVTDASGSESLREFIEIIYNPATPVKPKIWYAGIGVSKYRDSSMNLTYADKDIKDLEGIFKNKQQANTSVLLNTQATVQGIKQLKAQLMKSNEEDIVVLSLSGHGLVNKTGEFFFAGYETNFNQPEGSGVPFAMLEWLLDSIPARKKLMMIDACHSGELDKGITLQTAKAAPLDANVKEVKKGVITKVVGGSVGLQNSYELMKELFTDLSKSNGAEVISAAGGLEYAFENANMSNGVFTYCLKRALLENAADADKDNKVTINELKTYMISEVSKLTGGRQKPTVRQESIGTNWVVW